MHWRPLRGQAQRAGQETRAQQGVMHEKDIPSQNCSKPTADKTCCSVWSRHQPWRTCSTSSDGEPHGRERTKSYSTISTRRGKKAVSNPPKVWRTYSNVTPPPSGHKVSKWNSSAGDAAAIGCTYTIRRPKTMYTMYTPTKSPFKPGLLGCT